MSRALIHCRVCPSHRSFTFKEAMEDLVLLLVLLQTLTVKTSSLPYVAHSSEMCSGPEKYIREESGLCCSRCPPGYKMKEECTETMDTVCEPCGPEQFMENWNYARNCMSCNKCKRTKGLQYAHNCSSTTNIKCVCMPGRYCSLVQSNACQECSSYRKCKEGFGVSQPGTATSNVKCKGCPEGTFSDSVSYTEACKPHSICDERHIISKGNTTSDTVCKIPASTQPGTEHTTKPETTTMPVTMAGELWKLNSTSPGNVLFSTKEMTNQTKNHRGPDKELAAVIGVIVGIFLLLIVIVLLVFCKRVSKNVTLENCPKVDANGNSEITTDNTNLCYVGDTEQLTFKVVQPEQQCFLKNGHNNQNQYISNTDGCTSRGYQQSTLPDLQHHSALSEPLPLQSNIDQVISQIGSSLQSSSQPTSPQSMAPSPLVNVNINLHIGNGTCGPPAVMLRDTPPEEPKIPFGEEEESCSLLQQEDGKPSLLSVEESGSFSNMSLKH